MGGRHGTGAGDDLVDGPVDLAAVRADDAMLDGIAHGSTPDGRGHGGSGLGGPGYRGASDNRLAAVLAAWRADIESDPMPEIVTLDEAAEAVSAGQEARERVESRSRRRMPFAVAAAAAVVAFSGLTVAVHGAMPGDTLWGISTVVFSDRAESVQKVEDVRARIESANGAIARGDLDAARSQLRQVDIQIAQIEPEQQASLVEQRDKVRRSLQPAPPRQQAPASPGSGPGAASDSSSAATSPGPSEPSPTPQPAPPGSQPPGYQPSGSQPPGSQPSGSQPPGSQPGSEEPAGGGGTETSVREAPAPPPGAGTSSGSTPPSEGPTSPAPPPGG